MAIDLNNKIQNNTKVKEGNLLEQVLGIQPEEPKKEYDITDANITKNIIQAEKERVANVVYTPEELQEYADTKDIQKDNSEAVAHSKVAGESFLGSALSTAQMGMKALTGFAGAIPTYLDKGMKGSEELAQQTNPEYAMKKVESELFSKNYKPETMLDRFNKTAKELGNEFALINMKNETLMNKTYQDSIEALIRKDYDNVSYATTTVKSVMEALEGAGSDADKLINRGRVRAKINNLGTLGQVNVYASNLAGSLVGSQFSPTLKGLHGAVSGVAGKTSTVLKNSKIGGRILNSNVVKASADYWDDGIAKLADLKINNPKTYKVLSTTWGAANEALEEAVTDKIIESPFSDEVFTDYSEDASSRMKMEFMQEAIGGVAGFGLAKVPGAIANGLYNLTTSPVQRELDKFGVNTVKDTLSVEELEDRKQFKDNLERTIAENGGIDLKNYVGNLVDLEKLRKNNKYANTKAFRIDESEVNSFINEGHTVVNTDNGYVAIIQQKGVIDTIADEVEKLVGGNKKAEATTVENIMIQDYNEVAGTDNAFEVDNNEDNIKKGTYETGGYDTTKDPLVKESVEYKSENQKEIGNDFVLKEEFNVDDADVIDNYNLSPSETKGNRKSIDMKSDILRKEIMGYVDAQGNTVPSLTKLKLEAAKELNVPVGEIDKIANSKRGLTESENKFKNSKALEAYRKKLARIDVINKSIQKESKYSDKYRNKYMNRMAKALRISLKNMTDLSNEVIDRIIKEDLEKIVKQYSKADLETTKGKTVIEKFKNEINTDNVTDPKYVNELTPEQIAVVITLINKEQDRLIIEDYNNRLSMGDDLATRVNIETRTFKNEKGEDVTEIDPLNIHPKEGMEEEYNKEIINRSELYRIAENRVLAELGLQAYTNVTEDSTVKFDITGKVAKGKIKVDLNLDGTTMIGDPLVERVLNNAQELFSGVQQTYETETSESYYKFSYVGPERGKYSKDPTKGRVQVIIIPKSSRVKSMGSVFQRYINQAAHARVFYVSNTGDGVVYRKYKNGSKDVTIAVKTNSNLKVYRSGYITTEGKVQNPIKDQLKALYGRNFIENISDAVAKAQYQLDINQRGKSSIDAKHNKKIAGLERYYANREATIMYNRLKKSQRELERLEQEAWDENVLKPLGYKRQEDVVRDLEHNNLSDIFVNNTEVFDITTGTYKPKDPNNTSSVGNVRIKPLANTKIGADTEEARKAREFIFKNIKDKQNDFDTLSLLRFNIGTDNFGADHIELARTLPGLFETYIEFNKDGDTNTTTQEDVTVMREFDDQVINTVNSKGEPVTITIKGVINNEIGGEKSTWNNWMNKAKANGLTVEQAVISYIYTHLHEYKIGDNAVGAKELGVENFLSKMGLGTNLETVREVLDNTYTADYILDAIIRVQADSMTDKAKEFLNKYLLSVDNSDDPEQVRDALKINYNKYKTMISNAQEFLTANMIVDSRDIEGYKELSDFLNSNSILDPTLMVLKTGETAMATMSINQFMFNDIKNLSKTEVNFVKGFTSVFRDDLTSYLNENYKEVDLSKKENFVKGMSKEYLARFSDKYKDNVPALLKEIEAIKTGTLALSNMVLDMDANTVTLEQIGNLKNLYQDIYNRMVDIGLEPTENEIMEFTGRLVSSPEIDERFRVDRMFNDLSEIKANIDSGNIDAARQKIIDKLNGTIEDLKVMFIDVVDSSTDNKGLLSNEDYKFFYNMIYDLFPVYSNITEVKKDYGSKMLKPMEMIEFISNLSSEISKIENANLIENMYLKMLTLTSLVDQYKAETTVAKYDFGAGMRGFIRLLAIGTDKYRHVNPNELHFEKDSATKKSTFLHEFRHILDANSTNTLHNVEKIFKHIKINFDRQSVWMDIKRNVEIVYQASGDTGRGVHSLWYLSKVINEKSKTDVVGPLEFLSNYTVLMAALNDNDDVVLNNLIDKILGAKEEITRVYTEIDKAIAKSNRELRKQLNLNSYTDTGIKKYMVLNLNNAKKNLERILSENKDNFEAIIDDINDSILDQEVTIAKLLKISSTDYNRNYQDISKAFNRIMISYWDEMFYVWEHLKKGEYYEAKEVLKGLIYKSDLEDSYLLLELLKTDDKEVQVPSLEYMLEYTRPIYEAMPYEMYKIYIREVVEAHTLYVNSLTGNPRHQNIIDNIAQDYIDKYAKYRGDDVLETQDPKTAALDYMKRKRQMAKKFGSNANVSYLIYNTMNAHQFGHMKYNETVLKNMMNNPNIDEKLKEDVGALTTIKILNSKQEPDFIKMLEGVMYKDSSSGAVPTSRSSILNTLLEAMKIKAEAIYAADVTNALEYEKLKYMTAAMYQKEDSENFMEKTTRELMIDAILEYQNYFETVWRDTAEKRIPKDNENAIKENIYRKFSRKIYRDYFDLYDSFNKSYLGDYVYTLPNMFEFDNLVRGINEDVIFKNDNKELYNFLKQVISDITKNKRDYNKETVNVKLAKYEDYPVLDLNKKEKPSESPKWQDTYIYTPKMDLENKLSPEARVQLEEMRNMFENLNDESPYKIKYNNTYKPMVEEMLANNCYPELKYDVDKEMFREFSNLHFKLKMELKNTNSTEATKEDTEEWEDNYSTSTLEADTRKSLENLQEYMQTVKPNTISKKEYENKWKPIIDAMLKNDYMDLNYQEELESYLKKLNAKVSGYIKKKEDLENTKKDNTKPNIDKIDLNPTIEKTINHFYEYLSDKEDNEITTAVRAIMAKAIKNGYIDVLDLHFIETAISEMKQAAKADDLIERLNSYGGTVYATNPYGYTILQGGKLLGAEELKSYRDGAVMSWKHLEEGTTKEEVDMELFLLGTELKSRGLYLSKVDGGYVLTDKDGKPLSKNFDYKDMYEIVHNLLLGEEATAKPEPKPEVKYVNITKTTREKSFKYLNLISGVDMPNKQEYEELLLRASTSQDIEEDEYKKIKKIFKEIDAAIKLKAEQDKEELERLEASRKSAEEELKRKAQEELEKQEALRKEAEAIAKAKEEAERLEQEALRKEQEKKEQEEKAKEAKKATKKKAQSDNTNEKLKEELEKIKNELEQAKKDSKEKSKELDRLEKENSKKSKELDKYKSELDKLSVDFAQAKSDMANKGREATEKEKAKLAELERKYKEKEKMLNEALKQSKEALNKLEKSSKEANNTKEKLDKTKEDMDALTETLKGADKENKELAKAKAKAEKESEKAKAKADELEKEKERLQEALKKHKENIAKREKELEEAKKNVIQKLSPLQKLIDFYKEEIDRARVNEVLSYSKLTQVTNAIDSVEELIFTIDLNYSDDAKLELLDIYEELGIKNLSDIVDSMDVRNAIIRSNTNQEATLVSLHNALIDFFITNKLEDGEVRKNINTLIPTKVSAGKMTKATFIRLVNILSGKVADLELKNGSDKETISVLKKNIKTLLENESNLVENGLTEVTDEAEKSKLQKERIKNITKSYKLLKINPKGFMDFINPEEDKTLANGRRLHKIDYENLSNYTEKAEDVKKMSEARVRAKQYNNTIAVFKNFLKGLDKDGVKQLYIKGSPNNIRYVELVTRINRLNRALYGEDLIPLGTYDKEGRMKEHTKGIGGITEEDRTPKRNPEVFNELRNRVSSFTNDINTQLSEGDNTPSYEMLGEINKHVKLIDKELKSVSGKNIEDLRKHMSALLKLSESYQDLYGVNNKLNKLVTNYLASVENAMKILGRTPQVLGREDDVTFINLARKEYGLGSEIKTSTEKAANLRLGFALDYTGLQAKVKALMNIKNKYDSIGNSHEKFIYNTSGYNVATGQHMSELTAEELREIEEFVDPIALDYIMRLYKDGKVFKKDFLGAADEDAIVIGYDEGEYVPMPYSEFTPTPAHMVLVFVSMAEDVRLSAPNKHSEFDAQGLSKVYLSRTLNWFSSPEVGRSILMALNESKEPLTQSSYSTKVPTSRKGTGVSERYLNTAFGNSNSKFLNNFKDSANLDIASILAFGNVWSKVVAEIENVSSTLTKKTKSKYVNMYNENQGTNKKASTEMLNRGPSNIPKEIANILKNKTGLEVSTTSNRVREPYDIIKYVSKVTAPLVLQVTGTLEFATTNLLQSLIGITDGDYRSLAFAGLQDLLRFPRTATLLLGTTLGMPVKVMDNLTLAIADNLKNNHEAAANLFYKLNDVFSLINKGIVKATDMAAVMPYLNIFTDASIKLRGITDKNIKNLVKYIDMGVMESCFTKSGFDTENGANLVDMLDGSEHNLIDSLINAVTNPGLAIQTLGDSKRREIGIIQAFVILDNILGAKNFESLDNKTKVYLRRVGIVDNKTFQESQEYFKVIIEAMNEVYKSRITVKRGNEIMLPNPLDIVETIKGLIQLDKEVIVGGKGNTFRFKIDSLTNVGSVEYQKISQLNTLLYDMSSHTWELGLNSIQSKSDNILSNMHSFLKTFGVNTMFRLFEEMTVVTQGDGSLRKRWELDYSNPYVVDSIRKNESILNKVITYCKTTKLDASVIPPKFLLGLLGYILFKGLLNPLALYSYLQHLVQLATVSLPAGASYVFGGDKAREKLKEVYDLKLEQGKDSFIKEYRDIIALTYNQNSLDIYHNAAIAGRYATRILSDDFAKISLGLLFDNRESKSIIQVAYGTMSNIYNRVALYNYTAKSLDGTLDDPNMTVPTAQNYIPDYKLIEEGQLSGRALEFGQALLGGVSPHLDMLFSIVKTNHDSSSIENLQDKLFANAETSRSNFLKASSNNTTFNIKHKIGDEVTDAAYEVAYDNVNSMLTGLGMDTKSSEAAKNFTELKNMFIDPNSNTDSILEKILDVFPNLIKGQDLVNAVATIQTQDAIEKLTSSGAINDVGLGLLAMTTGNANNEDHNLKNITKLVQKNSTRYLIKNNVSKEVMRIADDLVDYLQLSGAEEDKIRMDILREYNKSNSKDAAILKVLGEDELDKYKFYDAMVYGEFENKHFNDVKADLEKTYGTLPTKMLMAAYVKAQGNYSTIDSYLKEYHSKSKDKGRTINQQHILNKVLDDMNVFSYASEDKPNSIHIIIPKGYELENTKKRIELLKESGMDITTETLDIDEHELMKENSLESLNLTEAQLNIVAPKRIEMTDTQANDIRANNELGLGLVSYDDISNKSVEELSKKYNLPVTKQVLIAERENSHMPDKIDASYINYSKDPRVNQRLADFYNKYKNLSIAFGVSPSILVAQFAQETGAGKSKIMTESNVMFAMKAQGNTNEYWKGKTKRLRDNALGYWAEYRAYDTEEESVMDYLRLLRDRYKAPTLGSVHKLKGYAEDPNYISSVSRIARGIESAGIKSRIAQDNILNSEMNLVMENRGLQHEDNDLPIKGNGRYVSNLYTTRDFPTNKLDNIDMQGIAGELDKLSNRYREKLNIKSTTPNGKVTIDISNLKNKEALLHDIRKGKVNLRVTYPGKEVELI